MSSNKYKICFVILHYKTFEETEKCIASIKNRLGEDNNYKIIVVDNGSNNSTGEMLINKYKSDKVVDIILSKENLGFSVGNNLGCKYGIDKYNPDYLCVLNNDTELVTTDLINILDQQYVNTNFDLLAPEIWSTVQKCNQNPFFTETTYKNILKRNKELRRQMLFCKLNLFFIYAIYIKLRNMFFQKKKNKEFAPHGAVLIFSKQYISKYNEIFLEKSFLYGEEGFLNFRKKRDNLVFCYNFDIKFIHNESISTKSTISSKNEKWKFQVIHMKKASDELVKLYKEANLI